MSKSQESQEGKLTNIIFKAVFNDNMLTQEAVYA